VLLDPKKALTDPFQHWKLVLIASFLVASNIYFIGGFPELTSGISFLGYAIGGFFVGLGTKLGSGCTSGHGICGLARRSERSVVSVITFMTVGVAVSTLLSSSLFKDYVGSLRTTEPTLIPIPRVGAALTMLALVYAILEPVFVASKPETKAYRRYLFPAAAVSGALFAVGLSLSGMVTARKLVGFLDLNGIANGTYDPTLMTVMGAGSIVSFISYQFVEGHNVVSHDKVLSRPLAHKESNFAVPSIKIIDWQLIVGAMIFGLGWAIGGLCPGPALVHAAVGSTGPVLYWWPTFYIGAHLGQELKTR